jgi:hypothetical protein
MRVCVVEETTARHYKRGSRLPSPQAQRLWWLHIQGRVLGQEWRRFRVRGGSLVDEAGTAFQENEIATIPLLHQRVAELQVQLDKYRYEGAMGQLGVFELSDALRTFLNQGAKLLEAVEKVPRRRVSKLGRVGGLESQDNF